MFHSNGSGNRRQQQQQQQFGMPNINVQQLINNLPEIQNLMNLNQIIGQQASQGAMSQSHLAATQAAAQMMGSNAAAAGQHYQGAAGSQQYRQPRPPQQSHAPAQDVNLVLNDHNAGLDVTERDAIQSLTLNGHNNQVGVHEGVRVPCILTNGHNNFLYSQPGSRSSGQGCESYGRVDRLIVQGHNNRYERLVALEIEIYGHNNQFSEIYCQNLVDQGQSNKFRHLFQLEQQQVQGQRDGRHASGQSNSHQSNDRRRQSRQGQNHGGREQHRHGQAPVQQAAPQYEFSTDEEAEFEEEYGEEIEVDPHLLQAAAADDDDEDEGLIYEELECEDGNPSEPSMYIGGAQYPHQQQMQTTVTLNINGQPVQMMGGQDVGAQGAAAMDNIPHLNNLQQLTNIIDSINPYLGMQGQQNQADPAQFQQPGFGGTFFTQEANNGGYYSSNGHTINIQGLSSVSVMNDVAANGGNIRVSVDQNGQAYYEGEDDLLDEFPQDPEEGVSEGELYYEEENLDSDGEPLPSENEIKDIINSIPSFRFEEATDGYESSMSMAASQSSKKKQSQKSTQDSFTERKRKEIKRQEKEVSCSICLEVLRTGNQVKQLQCKHLFHASCIHSWLKQKLQCPNCKKKVRL